MLPELTRLLKRYLPDNEPIALNLKAAPVFSSTTELSWYQQNGYNQILAALSSGASSYSGEIVNVNSALTHSVVWICNRIISESIGFLPAILYQDTAQGKRKATEHPAYSLMKSAPNEEITAQTF